MKAHEAPSYSARHPTWSEFQVGPLELIVQQRVRFSYKSLLY